MLNLSVETWIRFLVWMALGVVVYLAYGRRKSVLGQKLAAQAGPPRGGEHPGTRPALI